MSKLIKGVQAPTRINPKTLIVFSLPKAGKTHAFSKLKDHLIIDCDPDKPTDYYSTNAVAVNNINDFTDLLRELKEENAHFTYIVVDTITSMMDSVIRALAVRKYNKEEEETQPLTWDISGLQYGKGWGYIREAAKTVVTVLKPYCDYLILSGHVADKYITKNGNELTIKTVDLPGKLKNIMAVSVDAIGLFYRADKNKNVLSFKHDETDAEAGTRSPHLRNKDIVITELITKDDGTEELIDSWDKVYL